MDRIFEKYGYIFDGYPFCDCPRKPLGNWYLGYAHDKLSIIGPFLDYGVFLLVGHGL